ncbi:hypothetical protein CPB85DRAFT_1435761 [Mucidula mucida]|nr:hypothetical protein CPB85DRAFT_1435761 [Mucidula mucida]
MPFAPVLEIDPQRAARAREKMCEVFDVPELRDFQEEAGQNILLGHSTFLDVPTGGGKTLAIWYALFYHMATTSDGDEGSKKVIVVLSPEKSGTGVSSRASKRGEAGALLLGSGSGSSCFRLPPVALNRFTDAEATYSGSSECVRL